MFQQETIDPDPSPESYWRKQPNASRGDLDLDLGQKNAQKSRIQIDLIDLFQMALLDLELG